MNSDDPNCNSPVYTPEPPPTPEIFTFDCFNLGFSAITFDNNVLTFDSTLVTWDND